MDIITNCQYFFVKIVKDYLAKNPSKTTNAEKVTENSKVQELDIDQLDKVSGGGILEGIIDVLTRITSF